MGVAERRDLKEKIANAPYVNKCDIVSLWTFVFFPPLIPLKMWTAVFFMLTLLIITT